MKVELLWKFGKARDINHMNDVGSREMDVGGEES